VSAYLDGWLPGKVKLRPSTRTAYAAHIRLYLAPALGHLLLVELRAHHIAAMLAMIRSGELRPDRRRHSMDTVTSTTVRLVFTTLHSALSSAVKQHLIPFNPCQGVELEERHRPPVEVWTPEAGGCVPRSC